MTTAAVVGWLSCDGSSLVQPLSGTPRIDVGIAMTSSATSAEPGEQVVFTVTVRNNGPVDATRLIAGDSLPAGLTYVSHSVSAGTFSPIGVWDIGALPIYEEATLTLRATIAPGAAGTTLVNRAGVLSTAQYDSLPDNNVATVSVTIPGTPPPLPPPVPPPPGSIVFSSDWSTATGTSDNALTDGGRWDNIYCGNRASALTVVPGSTVGWTRTQNVLRLQQLGPSVCGTLERTDAVPLSTTHWGRFYFRNDETATRHNHVVTYNPGIGSPIQTSIWNRQGSSQGLLVFLRTYFTATGDGSSYPYDIWSIGVRGSAGITRLQNGVWYRYEWMTEYRTSTTYRIYPRIYDMNGALLFDENTFFQSDYNGRTHSLASYYASGGVFGVTDPRLARRFGLGNEGPAMSGNTGGYWYHAAVALSTSGWIGP